MQRDIYILGIHIKPFNLECKLSVSHKLKFLCWFVKFFNKIKFEWTQIFFSLQSSVHNINWLYMKHTQHYKNSFATLPPKERETHFSPANSELTVYYFHAHSNCRVKKKTMEIPIHVNYSTSILISFLCSIQYVLCIIYAQSCTPLPKVAQFFMFYFLI